MLFELKVFDENKGTNDHTQKSTNHILRIENHFVKNKGLWYVVIRMTDGKSINIQADDKQDAIKKQQKLAQAINAATQKKALVCEA